MRLSTLPIANTVYRGWRQLKNSDVSRHEPDLSNRQRNKMHFEKQVADCKQFIKALTNETGYNFVETITEFEGAAATVLTLHQETIVD